MAFVVEDGTGLPDATSYTSVEYFRSYFEDNGNEVAVAMQDADIEIALNQATTYMEATYKSSYVGRITKRSQALQWPRNGVRENGWYVYNYTIPINVQKACCEFAWASTLAPLFRIVKSNQNAVTEIRVGPIAKKYVPGMSSQEKIYEAAERHLSSLLSDAFGIVKTIRG
jgi:hypothetical protein